MEPTFLSALSLGPFL